MRDMPVGVAPFEFMKTNPTFAEWEANYPSDWAIYKPTRQLTELWNTPMPFGLFLQLRNGCTLIARTKEKGKHGNISGHTNPINKLRLLAIRAF